MKKVGKKWHKLNDEDKRKYHEIADQLNGLEVWEFLIFLYI